MANIASLGVKLGLDTATFQQGIADAKKYVGELKDALVEVAGVAAFAELTRKALEYSDSIVKTAKANDVAVASVLSLSDALMKNGGNAEETSRIYSGFTQKIESAILGNGKAQESFSKLGITLNDLAHLSEQELFDKTIQGLAQMKDSAERNGIAFQTLGRGIRGVDLKGLAADMMANREEMDKYAQAVTQAHDLSIKMQEASHKLMLEFTTAVLPALNALYDSLTKDSSALNIFFGILKDFATVGAVLFKYTSTVVLGFFTELEGIAAASGDLMKGNLTKALEDIKEYDDKVKAMAESDELFAQRLLNPPKETAKPQVQEDANRQVIAANQKQISAAQGLTQQYKEQADLTLTKLKQAQQEAELTTNQKELEKNINQVLNERQKMLDDIDKKISAARNTIGGPALIEQLQKQKAAIEDASHFYVDETIKATLATQEHQRSFSYGWEKAYAQYVQNSENAAMQAEQMFASITNSMTNALDKFVQTGKLNFGDLAKSIINDMLKIELHAQEMKLFGMIGGAISGGGAYGPTPDGGNIASGGIGSLFGFADGGQPPVGVPSIVGENGPELFVPQTAGTVIPNNKLADAMGGSQQPATVYNGPYIASMSAIDTQSATQFLAKNQNAVWGAYQNAQRGLPQTR